MRQQRGAWRLQEEEEEGLVLPVSISAPTRLPGLVELEPVGEGEALALAPPVVQPPPGVAVGADDHLPSSSCKYQQLASAQVLYSLSPPACLPNKENRRHKLCVGFKHQ